MNTIIMMCGLPRSGKSTWVKNNCDEKQVIVSADTLRWLVYNQRFWSEGEPLVWSIRGTILRMLMKQGKDIIIDETNTTITARKAIIKLAKEHNYTIICNVIEGISTENCIERAKQDDQSNLIPIITNMASKFEFPLKEEGIDIINMI